VKNEIRQYRRLKKVCPIPTKLQQLFEPLAMDQWHILLLGNGLTDESEICARFESNVMGHASPNQPGFQLIESIDTRPGG
jgi:hypothetical protein